MSDTNPATPSPQPAPVSAPPRKSFFGSKWFIGIAFAAVAVSAFGAGRITGRFSVWHQMAGYGGFSHGGGMHGMQKGYGPERMLDRVLSGVSATAEQRTRIEAIAREAFMEMSPIREQRRTAQLQLAQLLKADAVDRSAIDRLRSEQMVTAETVTRRWSKAIADAAEVLDANQRQQIVTRWESRRWWRG